jgi:hypothetical protein
MRVAKVARIQAGHMRFKKKSGLCRAFFVRQKSRCPGDRFKDMGCAAAAPDGQQNRASDPETGYTYQR